MKMLESNNLLFFFVTPTLILLLSTPAHALYSQPASTVASGGGTSISTNYSNLGVIAQPGIVDNSASACYKADHGFIPVLGGWRVLYPVISATPGILTFTLAPNTSDNKPVAISNAGGSTLKWSVAKGTPSETYFSVSPAMGTGNASVTVTANATDLSPGDYNDTLTISGNGISQTVQVQLNLTVTPSGLYRLTLTVKSDTADKGGGLVYNNDVGINCNGSGTTGATCFADLSPGTVLTLFQSPDSNSTWATWTGPCTPNGNDCTVTMNGAKAVTATFPYAHMAMLKNSGALYDGLQPAIDAAGPTNDAVYLRDVTFEGDVILDRNIILPLLGGLSPWYLPQNAWSTIHGKLTVQFGQLTVDKLVVK